MELTSQSLRRVIVRCTEGSNETVSPLYRAEVAAATAETARVVVDTCGVCACVCMVLKEVNPEWSGVEVERWDRGRALVPTAVEL